MPQSNTKKKSNILSLHFTVNRILNVGEEVDVANIPANSHALCVSLTPVDFDLTHRGQFLTSVSQIWRTYSLIQYQQKFNSIPPPKYCNKRPLMSSLSLNSSFAPRICCNLRKSSEYLRQCWEILGTFRQCLEVVGNFAEIRVIWIRKSHVFDLGKVGRYTLNQ